MKSYKFWYVLVFTKFLSIHFGSYLFFFANYASICRQKTSKYLVHGWWFGTLFIFPYIGNTNPNWLSYVSQVSSERKLPGCPAKWKQERTRTHDAPRCMMSWGTPCMSLGLFKVILDQRIGGFKGKQHPGKVHIFCPYLMDFHGKMDGFL